MGTDRASLHRLSGNTNEFQRQQPLPQMGWREEETEGERGAFAGAACLVSKPPLLINVTAELLHSPCAGVGWVGGRRAADSVRGTGAVQPFLLLHPQEGARKRKQGGYHCCMPCPSTQMAQRRRGEPVTTSNNLQRSEDCEPSITQSRYWDGGSLGMVRGMWSHPGTMLCAQRAALCQHNRAPEAVQGEAPGTGQHAAAAALHNMKVKASLLYKCQPVSSGY